MPTPSAADQASARAENFRTGFAGQSMREGQYRGQLGPIDLQMRRKRPGRTFRSRRPVGCRGQLLRSSSIFLIPPMALPGFNPLGHVRVQLRMV